MIGVAISTHRRPHVLAQSLAGWAHAMPDLLVVTHDVTGEGVAATKNRGIAALMDAGCEHLFLADDDVWPVSPKWAEPYTNDPLPHLMFCWGKARRLTRDNHYTTWGHPRGVMLYVHRGVIDDVGGMRTEFGRGGSEHVEWSRRIHQAGHTPAPYIDLTVSPTLWHAEDMGRPGESSAALAARRKAHTVIPKREAWKMRSALMDKYDGVVEFVDYR